MYAIATAYRNGAGDGRTAILDSAGGGEPYIELREADDDVLMTIGLNATAAVGDFANGVGTFNAPTSGGGAWATFSQNPSASGTLSYGVVIDSNSAEAWRFTCGVGTGEFQVDSLSFDTAIAVTMTTAPTLTEPAS